jgi:histidine triad (HIT) family protein
MEERPCIFCQIIKKEIPSRIVYEDENSVAFLDIAPRSKGMTIVAPRQHYTKPNENFEVSEKVFQSALIVSKMIERSLNPKSISFSIIESKVVPHFHIRIYPVYEDEIPLIEGQAKEMSEDELNSLANTIRGIKIELPKKEEKVPIEEEKVEEEKPEERDKEEVSYIRREMELT